jgi:hypothetical protein
MASPAITPSRVPVERHLRRIRWRLQMEFERAEAESVLSAGIEPGCIGGLHSGGTNAAFARLYFSGGFREPNVIV